MDEIIPSEPESRVRLLIDSRPDPGPTYVAVARCGRAYAQALRTALSAGKTHVDAVRAADRAFRSAMPQLLDSQSVLDFIACVTQGMLLGAIPDAQSSRLLYAAQVAASALRRAGEPSKPGA